MNQLTDSTAPRSFPGGSLPRFPAETLTRFQAAGMAPVTPAARGALDEHQRHTRRPTRRRTIDARHIANAATALSKLPDKGESLHLVCKGNSPTWLVVRRLIELAGPATVDKMRISTLGFSFDFAQALLGMIDAGEIADIGMLVSTYFRSTSEKEFAFLSAGLAARGQRIRVARTHAKIVACMMTDGRGFSLEGSGNLRACRMHENLCITNDVDLALFQMKWIDALLAQEDAR